MKYLVWLLSALNLYVGARCLLNVLGVLQTSKYSRTATALFAVLFLGMGVAGYFLTIARGDVRLGLLIAIGPWILGLLILLLTMLTSSYQ